MTEDFHLDIKIGGRYAGLDHNDWASSRDNGGYYLVVLKRLTNNIAGGQVLNQGS